MSDKQTLLKVVEAMPDGATWSEMTDRLLAVVARYGSPADFARLYRTQLTAADLAEYLDPKLEFALADVVAELKAMPATEAK
jgi:hypothetical protein